MNRHLQAVVISSLFAVVASSGCRTNGTERATSSSTDSDHPNTGQVRIFVRTPTSLNQAGDAIDCGGSAQFEATLAVEGASLEEQGEIPLYDDFPEGVNPAYCYVQRDLFYDYYQEGMIGVHVQISRPSSFNPWITDCEMNLHTGFDRLNFTVGAPGCGTSLEYP